MQMQKICKKAESILSFWYQNIITEGANMRQVKAFAPRWTFFFHWRKLKNFTMSLSEICL